MVELVHNIVAWINSQYVSAFYTGIRADCAYALRIAPNDEVFNAAFNLIVVSPADHYRDYMVASAPWGM